MISLWNCSAFFWDASKMFFASVTRERQDFNASSSGFVCSWSPAIITPWNESLGGSLFCSFWRRSTVSSNKDVNLFGYLLNAAKFSLWFRGLASSLGDLRAPSVCGISLILSWTLQHSSTRAKNILLALFTSSLKYVDSFFITTIRIAYTRIFQRPTETQALAQAFIHHHQITEQHLQNRLGRHFCGRHQAFRDSKGTTTRSPVANTCGPQLTTRNPVECLPANPNKCLANKTDHQ